MPGWLWRRRALAGSGLASLGCGLLIIGPTAFLPTYGQVVLGLGAIGAGAVLAAMSFGWPLTSSQSARLFLRIGFRDTGLLGAGTCFAAIASFLLVPGHRSVWLPVADTFVLGMGLGLLSVCVVVGPQSTVRWNQRGVVTGAIMFCRSLGQSLGAAIFGAIFNATVQAQLRTAPAALQGRLPHQVSAVGTALGDPAALGRAAAGYLRGAIAAATDHVYAGLALAALATIIVILVIVPRNLTVSTDDRRPGG